MQCIPLVYTCATYGVYVAAVVAAANVAHLMAGVVLYAAVAVVAVAAAGAAAAHVPAALPDRARRVAGLNSAQQSAAASVSAITLL